MLLLTLIVLPFLGSIAAAFMPTHARNREAWFAGAIALTSLLITLSKYTVIAEGELITFQLEWIAQFGLNLSFRMDGLAWLFTLMIQGICLLVILYARYYMSPKDPVPRFFSFLLAFMGAMLGVVLSGNLIQLVIFWELTSLTSFLLIGYWHHRTDARRGARMAFTVTALGGLCLLAGVILLGQVVGSYELDKVLAARELVVNHDWYLAIFLLIALGALTKSAQFPFHFWLPHAMAAPTPVSAYLHSATMVKAGIFLLMRLWPVLAGTPEWTWIIAGAGAITMLLGAYFAAFQHDLKGLLAYSTISHLGLITCLVGIGTPLAVVAAIFHTINHATFKASLFMAVGIIDHETGTRDLRKLSGIGRYMPYTATLAIVAGAAMAGVPLLNGFLSKEMFFAETLTVGSDRNIWLSVAAVLMGIFGVVYSLRLIKVFFGTFNPTIGITPQEPPRWMRFPAEFLVICCLVVGIFPELSVGLLLSSAAGSVLGDQLPQYNLAIWHGINIPLVMSFVALVGGILTYLEMRRRGVFTRDRTPLVPTWANGKQLFEQALLALTGAMMRLERIFGTRRVQRQVLILVLAALGAFAVIGFSPISLDAAQQSSELTIPFALLWLVGGACAIAAAALAKYHRLASLILAGGTGIVVCLTFLWFSAPDLALTQLMVETVTTLLLLLGLRWLPPRLMQGKPTLRKIARRSRDFIIAIIAGLGMTLISLVVMFNPSSSRISAFFLERALSEGGGSNVVNVLLVDFRALDTLGEITVLGVVAITVYALLRRFRPAPESVGAPLQQLDPIDPAARQTVPDQVSHGYLLVPSVYISAILPITFLIAVYFFMRGHNLPGGGFVAGLIFSVGLMMQYMLSGTAWVELKSRLQPHRWVSAGLLIAAATGIGAWFVGYPLLTSHTAHVTLPGIGEIHLPSAFMFDLGVFVAVVGTTMLIITALAHQALRSTRFVTSGVVTPPPPYQEDQ